MSFYGGGPAHSLRAGLTPAADERDGWMDGRVCQASPLRSPCLIRLASPPKERVDMLKVHASKSGCVEAVKLGPPP